MNDNCWALGVTTGPDQKEPPRVSSSVQLDVARQSLQYCKIIKNYKFFFYKILIFENFENFSKKIKNPEFESKTDLGNKYGYGDQLVDDQHICIKSKWDSEKAGFCNLADNGAPVLVKN